MKLKARVQTMKMAGKRGLDEEESLSAADISVKKGKHVLSERMLSVDEEDRQSQVSCPPAVCDGVHSFQYVVVVFTHCTFFSSRSFCPPFGRLVGWVCPFTTWNLPPCTSWQTVQSGKTFS